MADLDKVEGNKIEALFNQMIEKRVIVSMYMVGTDYERLTCITGIEQNAEGRRLCIDLPDGFRTAAQKAGEFTLRFNFNGPDKVEYLFTTKGGVLSGRDLIVPFPDCVERLQRRRNFRMETPIGTKLLIKMDKTHAIISLINISLGGTYGVLIKHNIKELQGSLLAENQVIHNMGILVPESEDRDEMVIIIKQAEVRRVEHDRNKKLYKYAFEFIDIQPTEMQKLTRAIYDFQRQFLKRR